MPGKKSTRPSRIYRFADSDTEIKGDKIEVSKIPVIIDEKKSMDKPIEFDIKQGQDLSYIIHSQIIEEGLASDPIRSADEFHEIGIRQILVQGFETKNEIENHRTHTDEDKSIQSIAYNFSVIDAEFKKPTKGDKPLYPIDAIKNNMNYLGRLYISAKLTLTANYKDTTIKPKVIEGQINNEFAGKLLVMVHSSACNLHGVPKEALRRLGEDPLDYGGYVIIGGNEWFINLNDIKIYNKPYIFHNQYQEEIYRCELISKPGDGYENSSQLLIMFMKGNRIVVRIDINPFKNIDFPFYILFRLLGVSSDQKMAEMIILKRNAIADDNISRYIANRLYSAFEAQYKGLEKVKNMFAIDTIAEYMCQFMTEMEFPSNIKEKANMFMSQLHKCFLPRDGSTKTNQQKKVNYLARVIRQIFMVEIGIIEATDRDGIEKRMKPAGRSMGGALKSSYNLSIRRSIIKSVENAILNESFSNINLVKIMKDCLPSAQLGKDMIRAIITANKEMPMDNKLKRGNSKKISAQQFQRKGPLSGLFALKQFNSAGSNSKIKSSQRSLDMRRVRGLYARWMCSNYSPEGESVGLTRQLCIGTFISQMLDSIHIIKLLKSDKDLEGTSVISPLDAYERKLYPILVNEDVICYTNNPVETTIKYRTLRRQGHPQVDKLVSIFWNHRAGEIHIYTDAGRLIRPVLIVYNNGEFKNRGKNFKQWLPITPSHIAGLQDGTVTIHDLVKDGIVEYLSADEQENCYFAPSYNELMRNRFNPLQRYTHCAINVDLYSILALVCPFSASNQAVRHSYQSAQTKLAAGPYSQNWYERTDKEWGMLMYKTQMPLVNTFINGYTVPNGLNIACAIESCFWNMQDSLVFNKTAIDLQIFHVLKITTYQAELEHNESRGIPALPSMNNPKPEALYRKINHTTGLPEVGAIIKPGEVIIGKHIKIKEDGATYPYSDRSIIYEKDEDARVITVLSDLINKDEKRIIKVVVAIERKVIVGNKFTNRSAQKGVNCLSQNGNDMMFSSNGIAPTVIINPHAFPTRMTISQIKEGPSAKLAALSCQFVDGSSHIQIDITKMLTELKKFGFGMGDRERLHNGRTGKPISNPINLCPIYYQCLIKFSRDALYSVTKGISDALTKQPQEGRSNKGGGKLGYMEIDTLQASHGMRVCNAKLFDHSDSAIFALCTVCNKPASYSPEAKLSKHSNGRPNIICVTCGDKANFVQIDSGWSSHMALDLSRTAGIDIRLIPEKYQLCHKGGGKFV